MVVLNPKLDCLVGLCAINCRDANIFHSFGKTSKLVLVRFFVFFWHSVQFILQMEHNGQMIFSSKLDRKIKKMWHLFDILVQ